MTEGGVVNMYLKITYCSPPLMMWLEFWFLSDLMCSLEARSGDHSYPRDECPRMQHTHKKYTAYD